MYQLKLVGFFDIDVSKTSPLLVPIFKKYDEDYYLASTRKGGEFITAFYYANYRKLLIRHSFYPVNTNTRYSIGMKMPQAQIINDELSLV